MPSIPIRSSGSIVSLRLCQKTTLARRASEGESSSTLAPPSLTRRASVLVEGFLAKPSSRGHPMTAALVLLTLALALRADEAPKGKSRPAEEYQALVDEHGE